MAPRRPQHGSMRTSHEHQPNSAEPEERLEDAAGRQERGLPDALGHPCRRCALASDQCRPPSALPRAFGRAAGGRPSFLEPLRQATGLACRCRSHLPCHVDVLIELLEGSPGLTEFAALYRGACRLLSLAKAAGWKISRTTGGCWRLHPSERRSRHRRGEAKREGPARRRGAAASDRAQTHGMENFS